MRKEGGRNFSRACAQSQSHTRCVAKERQWKGDHPGATCAHGRPQTRLPQARSRTEGGGGGCEGEYASALRAHQRRGHARAKQSARASPKVRLLRTVASNAGSHGGGEGCDGGEAGASAQPAAQPGAVVDCPPPLLLGHSGLEMPRARAPRRAVRREFARAVGTRTGVAGQGARVSTFSRGGGVKGVQERARRTFVGRPRCV